MTRRQLLGAVLLAAYIIFAVGVAAGILGAFS